MRKAIKLTLAVALMMSATSLFAQKFGRINTQEIIVTMPETKEMQTNLEAYAKDLEANIETINVEFNNKLQEFQKNMNTYSDAVRNLKQKELQELQLRSEGVLARSAGGLPQEAERAAGPDHREGARGHQQSGGRRQLSGHLRHLGRLDGLLRRGRADRHRPRSAQGARHLGGGCRRCAERQRPISGSPPGGRAHRPSLPSDPQTSDRAGGSRRQQLPLRANGIR